MAFLEIMTKFNSACVFETVLHVAFIEIMRIKDLFSVCDNYSCPRASSIIPMRVCWYVGVQELHSFNASHECHEGQKKASFGVPELHWCNASQECHQGQKKASFSGGTLCTQIEERHEGHGGWQFMVIVCIGLIVCISPIVSSTSCSFNLSIVG